MLVILTPYIPTIETSQVYYHTMQEDFTQNRLHPGISLRFKTCEVWVRLFQCVSPIFNCCCDFPFGFTQGMAQEAIRGKFTPPIPVYENRDAQPNR